jgi:tetratricopeptide (TPR) repeat protein
LWQKALASLGSMTERERLRTLGLYYSIVTRNFGKAIETYEELVEKYPADDAAHNGLAVQYFYSLDFPSALKEGRVLLDIYPNSIMGRSNYSLYAMYASDFATAIEESVKVRELDPSYFKAWLAVAMNALAENDIESARDAYGSMAEASARGELSSTLGIADVALFSGKPDESIDALNAGIESSTAAGSQYFLATHYIALAEAQFASGSPDNAGESIELALATSGGLSRQVPAAMMYIEMGAADKAGELAATLGASLQPQSRAYGKFIEGMAALSAGEHVLAIDSLTAGIGFADLWLLRFSLGRAYLESGFFAEALDELTAASERHGEATSVFLDDLPTYRYAATLPYWLARAELELGMSDDALRHFEEFLQRRPGNDPLAQDARQRMN